MQNARILASFCALTVLALTRQVIAQKETALAATVCSADPKLQAFEVAAITPVADKDRRATSFGEYGLPQFTMRGVSLSSLLSFSFGVQPANFIHAPSGLENAVFDVQVKSADGVALSYEALKPRMQQMLQQRFCLKAQTGVKQVSGYALLVAKSGPKVKPLPTAGEGGSAYITQHELNGSNIDMGALASMLASPAERPVQDRTGLKGRYAIKVQFAPASDSESTLPSIFAAVKEQLGLELKPAQVPVSTLTVERLNLIPTEN